MAGSALLGEKEMGWGGWSTNVNYSEDRMFPVASGGKPEHNFKMIVTLSF